MEYRDGVQTGRGLTFAHRTERSVRDDEAGCENQARVLRFRLITRATAPAASRDSVAGSGTV